MIAINRVFLMFVLVGYAVTSSAANLADTTKKDTTAKSGTIKFGATFYSDDVFMGRSNRTAIPFLAPEIKYSFDFGLYLGGALDYLPQNTRNKIDGGELKVGYEFDVTDALSGDVSYSKPFYNTNSAQITSSFTDVFSANLEYEIENIVTPSVGLDYNVNRSGINSDLFLNIGVSHELRAKKIFSGDDEITITPAVALNAGTQNFYDAFLQRRLFKTTVYNAAQQQLITQFESGIGQFKILDYELSVPIKYKSAHFTFELMPEYDIVQNAFKATTLSKTLGVATSPGVFWISAGLMWEF